MPVITISRQYASGGSDIARRVAKRLDWPLIDNEFVDRVAREAGVPPMEVEEREERVPSLVERLARALAVSSPEVFVAAPEPATGRLTDEAELVRATEAVIQHAVREAPHLIMVGRGAQACLAQREDALHVFIVAPRDTRVRAAMRRLDVSKNKAEETVDGTDAGRRRYVEAYYNRDWDNADNYHLVINTGVFDYDDATSLVIEAARLRGWVGG